MVRQVIEESAGMYESYWGLSRPPFPSGPDSEGYIACRPHKAALLKLRYTVESDLGVAALTGEIGSGKTTVAGRLAHELTEAHGPFVHVVFPRLSPAELIGWLAVELGAEEQMLETADESLDVVLRELRTRLSDWSSRDQHPVLVIDEAHLLKNSPMLEVLMLLLNLRDSASVDFTLLLVGHTSLSALLTRVPQLADRLAVVAHLPSLSANETSSYITERLKSAGCERAVFSGDALAAIHRLTGGIPRAIGRVCDLSLLVGFADGLREIRAEEIHDVSLELPQAALKRVS
jgi:general secretion pathway protein A